MSLKREKIISQLNLVLDTSPENEPFFETLFGYLCDNKEVEVDLDNPAFKQNFDIENGLKAFEFGLELLKNPKNRIAIATSLRTKYKRFYSFILMAVALYYNDTPFIQFLIECRTDYGIGMFCEDIRKAVIKNAKFSSVILIFQSEVIRSKLTVQFNIFLKEYVLEHPEECLSISPENFWNYVDLSEVIPILNDKIDHPFWKLLFDENGKAFPLVKSVLSGSITVSNCSVKLFDLCFQLGELKRLNMKTIFQQFIQNGTELMVFEKLNYSDLTDVSCVKLCLEHYRVDVLTYILEKHFIPTPFSYLAALSIPLRKSLIAFLLTKPHWKFDAITRKLIGLPLFEIEFDAEHLIFCIVEDGEYVPSPIPFGWLTNWEEIKEAVLDEAPYCAIYEGDSKYFRVRNGKLVWKDGDKRKVLKFKRTEVNIAWMCSIFIEIEKRFKEFVPEEDVELLMKQDPTISKETAIRLLKETKGDLVQALMSLQNSKQ